MENLTCRQCGAEFVRAQGESGRPRVRCFDCSPRRIPAKQPYTSKVCTQCGVNYTGRAMSRYCSDACKWLARKARSGIPCTVCGEPTGWTQSSGKASVTHKKCSRPPCGTVASYSKRKCRCDDCKAANAQAMRDYAARRKAQGRPIRKAGRVDTFCSDCGVKLLTGKGKGVGPPLCSECGQARRDRRRSSLRRRKRLAAFAERQAEGVPANPRWPWVQGDCAYCGETFTRKGMASGYCSKRCRRKDKKAKWITTTRRMALYARDDWTCQLCFEPVDRDADPLSDWSPTLDHIVPQSHALIPDHSDANLRTAHRWCNAVRGDGTYHADFFEEAS